MQQNPQRVARILVADDYPTNQQVTQVYLQSAGHQVDMVNDGEEAIKAYQQGCFDLILMDVQMPNVDGYQATQVIRRLEDTFARSSRIPIVAMTALAMQGDREKCLDAGMNDYITKPVNKAELLQLVQKWLTPEVRGAATAEFRDAGTRATEGETPLPMDLAKAIDEFEGRRELLLAIVTEFLRRAEAQLEKMALAVKQADTETLRREAHAIKGGAANIHAAAVSLAAAQIEDAVTTGSPDGIEQRVTVLEAELQRLASYLRTQTAEE